jgi:hypothetical protein
MRREGLLKYGPVDAEGDYSIHGEIRILRSYAKLVSRPAYTDNMATVTPVEDDIRRRMTLTVADVPGEFVRRVNTSLAFLQQIRDDELTLCRWSRESARHTMEPEAFKESLAGLALPSACRRAAFEYRRRLDSLAKMPGRLGSVIEHSEWQALLNHDLLSVTETRAVTPLKPVT